MDGDRVDDLMPAMRSAYEQRKPDEISKLQDELVRLRQSLQDKVRIQRTLDREVVELRALAKESERQLQNIRRTLSFQIGHAILNANSVKGLVTLPIRIHAILRSRKAQRARSMVDARERRPADKIRYVAEALDLLKRQGVEAAAVFVRGLPDRQKVEKARALAEVAMAIRSEDPVRSAAFGLEATALNPREARLRTLAFDLYEEGRVLLADELVQAASAELWATKAQIDRVAAIRFDRLELDTPATLPPAASAKEGKKAAVAIIVARSLPAHADAITFRAQAVAEAYQAGGLAAVLITEPGYRYPVKGDGQAMVSLSEGGVRTVRLPSVADSFAGMDQVIAVAQTLGEEFEAQAVGSVHIVAEGRLALAAAFAARNAGLAYTLDVGAIPIAGGFGRSGWADTERFAAAWSRLSTVAYGAARVVARSGPIGTFVSRRCPGIEVEVVPDAVPPSFVRVGRAAQRDIRRELGVGESQPLIGLLSEVDQDGRLLEFLRAMPILRSHIPDLALVYGGSSRVSQSIRHSAAMMGIADAVIVPDGFVRQRLAQYVSSFALMVFPPQHQEAGLSPPFELQVALALKTPVVAIASEWAGDMLPAANMVERGDPQLLASAILAELRAAELRSSSSPG